MLASLYDFLQLGSRYIGQLELDSFLFVLNILGTIVFAVSGALTGRKHGFDLLGVMSVSFVTANGGGTICNLLLGNFPIFWVEDPFWIYLSVSAAVLTYFIGSSDTSRFPERLWYVLDAVGLIAFAITGAWVALGLHESYEVAILMGMLTGCGGGMLRDVLCNTHPFIFHKEIYATAALLAAAVFVSLIFLGVSPRPSMLTAFVCGLSLRLAALRYGWTLHLRRA